MLESFVLRGDVIISEHGVDLAYLAIRSQLRNAVRDFFGRISIHAAFHRYLLLELVSFVQLHQFAVLSKCPL